MLLGAGMNTQELKMAMKEIWKHFQKISSLIVRLTGCSENSDETMGTGTLYIWGQLWHGTDKSPNRKFGSSAEGNVIAFRRTLERYAKCCVTIALHWQEVNTLDVVREVSMIWLPGSPPVRSYIRRTHNLTDGIPSTGDNPAITGIRPPCISWGGLPEESLIWRSSSYLDTLGILPWLCSL